MKPPEEIAQASGVDGETVRRATTSANAEVDLPKTVKSKDGKTYLTTGTDWLMSVFADNATMGNTRKSWHVGDNHTPIKIRKKPEFQTFLGTGG